MGSIGMTCLIIACTMGSIWPVVVIIFYILAPLPTLITNNILRTGGTSSLSMDIAIFITMGIVVSSFGLPIVMARAPGKVIAWDSCYLTLASNIVIYSTWIGFFLTVYLEESVF